MGLGCRPAVLTETVPQAKREGPGSGAPVLEADLGAGPHLPGPAPAPQLSYLQGPVAEGARRAVQDARWLHLGKDAEAESV